MDKIKTTFGDYCSTHFNGLFRGSENVLHHREAVLSEGIEQLTQVNKLQTLIFAYLQPVGLKIKKFIHLTVWQIQNALQNKDKNYFAYKQTERNRNKWTLGTILYRKHKMEPKQVDVSKYDAIVFLKQNKTKDHWLH